jgi:hypothetical protein
VAFDILPPIKSDGRVRTRAQLDFEVLKS